jgi:hypothetical protein
MRLKELLFAGILALLGSLPGISATLAVGVNATPVAGLYNYAYQFSVTGAGASVDNIFLGSDDLSPLDVVLEVDGAPTADWSWLGNDTPQNYLQFFDTNGTSLGDGDVLSVTFTSQLAPANASFALGLDSSTGDTTNTVDGVIAPTAATPEPGSLLLLFSGATLFALSFAIGFADKPEPSRLSPAVYF